MGFSSVLADEIDFDFLVPTVIKTAYFPSDAKPKVESNRQSTRAVAVSPKLWQKSPQIPFSDWEHAEGLTTYQASASPPPESFVKQLFYNVKGIFSTQNLPPLLIGSAAAGLSTTLDSEVKEEFDSSRRFKEFGDFGDALGHPLTLGLYSGGIFLWSYQTENDQFRSLGFSLAQAYLLNMGLTAGLKAATSRPRPDGDDKESFPSGHSSAAFTAATVTSHFYPKFAIPAYFLAGVVALSRIEKNKHYLSDVFAGATLGYVVGQTVVRGTQAANKSSISWMPTVTADGGMGVTLLVPF